MTYMLPAVLIFVVIVVRWRRMSRLRPLRLEYLWLLPTAYGLLVLAMYAHFPLTGLAYALCAGAALLGGVMGWQWGKMIRIIVDPETHALKHASSRAAMLFILVLLFVRWSAREVLAKQEIKFLNTIAITDILMALALGLLATQRLEMYLRGRRLLSENKLCVEGGEFSR